jgi:hypothetical protein
MLKSFEWTCNTIFFNVIWEHLEKLEMDIINVEYPKRLLK